MVILHIPSEAAHVVVVKTCVGRLLRVGHLNLAWVKGCGGSCQGPTCVVICTVDSDGLSNVKATALPTVTGSSNRQLPKFVWPAVLDHSTDMPLPALPLTDQREAWDDFANFCAHTCSCGP